VNFVLTVMKFEFYEQLPKESRAASCPADEDTVYILLAD
jgi:hypothetical protein